MPTCILACTGHCDALCYYFVSSVTVFNFIEKDTCCSLMVFPFFKEQSDTIDNIVRMRTVLLLQGVDLALTYLVSACNTGILYIIVYQLTISSDSAVRHCLLYYSLLLVESSL